MISDKHNSIRRKKKEGLPSNVEYIKSVKAIFPLPSVSPKDSKSIVIKFVMALGRIPHLLKSNPYPDWQTQKQEHHFVEFHQY